MGMGSLTWACLLLVLHAEPADPRGQLCYWNARQMMIPITQSKKNVSRYVLHVSQDLGTSWSSYQTVKPVPGVSEPLSFNFTTQKDGEYWLKLAEVDLQEVQHPSNIMTAPVSLRVIVDTTPPRVKLHAERKGQEIEVHWTIEEEHPEPLGPRLEYHTAEMPPNQPWTPVPPEAGASQAHFNPGTNSAVQVRLRLRDLARNEGSDSVTVAAAGRSLPAGGGEIGTVSNWTTDTRGLPAHTASQLSTTPTPDPIEPHRQVSGSGMPLSHDEERPGPSPAPGPAPAQNPAAQSSTRPAPSTGFPGMEATPAPSGNVPGNGSAPTTSAPAAPPMARELGSPPAQPPQGAFDGMSAAGRTPPTPLAQSFSSGAEGTAGSSETPAGSLPEVQLVNQPNVMLDFEVGRCGPSGLGSVDVYVSSDNGATWVKMDGVPPVSLPPTSATQPGVAVKGSVTVVIPREHAVYGFYMVVKNRAGLGHPAPLPGTPPQMRIELDRTLPEAKLYPPQPNPTNPNAALLIWEASDNNLTKEPITLEWAKEPRGPWIPIATNLPNTGKYSWELPKEMPTAVFLRLSAADRAGNVAVAATPKPVLIDLTPPEFRVLGVHRP